MTIITPKCGYIFLKDALRFVLYSNGEIGQLVASNWYNIPNPNLSREEIDIFRACALRLFTWLEAGKIEASYIPDGQIEDASIRRSTWGCHGFDAVRWELSAIRPPGHRPITAPQIENIKLSGEELERLTSQPTSAAEVTDSSKDKPKPRNHLLVLKIVDELALERTYIDETISNSMVVSLIQTRLSQKRAAGDKAVPKLSRETILRALDRM
ncbi:hypothetical protein FV222_13360 [Methylobacterium sp. WL103]|uniref:hypothetical protein n=1 Tax=Methylobacterium sp. WL103 TaxID=2603891 RepID=UPI0011C6F81B|nr:hypothetical protein [Methylobacterium sp. WL103]TXM99220.1 hypothetical protein FV222_13360 [Methylobacterium sp. WL103]